MHTSSMRVEKGFGKFVHGVRRLATSLDWAKGGGDDIAGSGLALGSALGRGSHTEVLQQLLLDILWEVDGETTGLDLGLEGLSKLLKACIVASSEWVVVESLSPSNVLVNCDVVHRREWNFWLGCSIVVAFSKTLAVARGCNCRFWYGLRLKTGRGRRRSLGQHDR